MAVMYNDVVVTQWDGSLVRKPLTASHITLFPSSIALEATATNSEYWIYQWWPGAMNSLNINSTQPVHSISVSLSSTSIPTKNHQFSHLFIKRHISVMNCISFRRICNICTHKRHKQTRSRVHHKLASLLRFKYKSMRLNTRPDGNDEKFIIQHLTM